MIQFSEFVEFFKPGLQGTKGTHVKKMVASKLQATTRSFADQLKDINNLRELEDAARVSLDDLHNLEERRVNVVHAVSILSIRVRAAKIAKPISQSSPSFGLIAPGGNGRPEGEYQDFRSSICCMQEQRECIGCVLSFWFVPAISYLVTSHQASRGKLHAYWKSSEEISGRSTHSDHSKLTAILARLDATRSLATVILEIRP